MPAVERGTFDDAWLRRVQVREPPDRPQPRRGSKHCNERNALLVCLVRSCVLSIVGLPRTLAAARKPRARHRLPH